MERFLYWFPGIPPSFDFISVSFASVLASFSLLVVECPRVQSFFSFLHLPSRSGVLIKPGHRPVLVCGPVRDQTTHQEVRDGLVVKVHLYLQPVPIACMTA